MSDMDDLALSFACPYCGVGPGEWCRTSPGNHRSSYLHGGRSGPIYSAWRIGFREGLADVLDAYDNNPSYFERQLVRRRTGAPA